MKARLKVRPALVLLLCAVLVGALFWQESRRVRPPAPRNKRCLACHEGVADPDQAHQVAGLGCAVCHGGNPFSLDKRRAHQGLILRPGNLDTAAFSCGRGECHPSILARVQKSIMATNRGIIGVLRFAWGEAQDPDQGPGVPELRRAGRGAGGEAGRAVDHYRKFCGGCHLYKPRGDLPGEAGTRGGGCADCHVVPRPGGRHPALTSRVPNDNCLKCHNRSARIGLSYLGRYESAGYGTPFVQGRPGPRRLSGGRFYLELPPDVHHEKGRLACIDCHTETGVMGGGRRADHMEDQEDIACQDCHRPRPARLKGTRAELAARLVRANGLVPAREDEAVPLSRRDSPLYHLRREKEGWVLYGKLDGRPRQVPLTSERPAHTFPPAGRLKCQACHSLWMPQCYGCHVQSLGQLTQRDWLDGRVKPGRYAERRSYLRFAEPTLGLGPEGLIEPVAPGCQVFFTAFDGQGRFRPEESFTVLAYAAWDPHTTLRRSRTCRDCHLNPKALGLGQGRLEIGAGGLKFEPLYQSRAAGLGLDHALETIVTPEGRAVQSFSRRRARPFTRAELGKITAVGRCLPCHDSFADPIYRDFAASQEVFRRRGHEMGRERAVLAERLKRYGPPR